MKADDGVCAEREALAKKLVERLRAAHMSETAGDKPLSVCITCELLARWDALSDIPGGGS